MSDMQKENSAERRVANFDNLKDADGLRSELIFNIKPPPFIYVVTHDPENGPWDVNIANEFGGRMNDEDFKKVQKVCEQFLDKLKIE